jgi:hypothetical protein
MESLKVNIHSPYKRKKEGFETVGVTGWCEEEVQCNHAISFHMK